MSLRGSTRILTGDAKVKPYYSRDGITIYNADWSEVLPRLTGVKAIVTDPPFFMPAQHYQSRREWPRAWSDTSILAQFWAHFVKAAKGALREDGHLLTFCNAESYPVFYPAMYRHFDTLGCLVWDKCAMGLGRGWRHQHELIIAARWKESEVYGASSRTDVLRHKSTPSKKRNHPVEKPAALLAELIEAVSQPNDLIVDAFMGGGSTLAAAQANGRRAIGIELEEKYCEIAARRLDEQRRTAAA